MERQHVMIVEDDEMVADMLGMSLEMRGYETTIVNTGEEALEKVKEDPPGVIVLDFKLPGIDGDVVCEEVRKLYSLEELPVIIITAVSDTDVGERIEGLEINMYLRKPFKPKILMNKIEELLSK